MPLNSGAGQGTIMGLFLFCVMFNGAGPKPSTEPLGVAITQARNARKPVRKCKKKWVDDLSLWAPIRLQDKLVQNTRPAIIGPATFHNRTGQILPKDRNTMQSELDLLNEYCRTS